MSRPRYDDTDTVPGTREASESLAGRGRGILFVALGELGGAPIDELASPFSPRRKSHPT